MTQINGSVYADKIEEVKKTNFELELKKVLDCCLDGHGNYTSNLVSCENEIFVNYSFPEIQRDLFESIGSANDAVTFLVKVPIAMKNAKFNKIVPEWRQTHATQSKKV